LRFARQSQGERNAHGPAGNAGKCCSLVETKRIAESKMSDTKQFAFSNLKELAVLVPVFGTAIAITYDVGFFWGLDINYFTLFSLTEHIVFAIEALPVALGLSFTLAVLFVVFKATDQRKNDKAEREMATLNAQQKSEWLRQSAARDRRIALRWVAFSLASLPLAWLGHPLLSIIVFTCCMSLQSIGALFYPKILYSPFFVANSVVTVSLLITFAVGVDVQQRFVRGGKVAHAISLENSELTGRIVRAGERGLLFYDPGSREISFVRWETVKRIRTVPQT
jgi:hypothetical protein